MAAGTPIGLLLVFTGGVTVVVYTPLRSIISGGDNTNNLVSNLASAIIEAADNTLPLAAAQNTDILKGNNTNATLSGSNNRDTIS